MQLKFENQYQEIISPFTSEEIIIKINDLIGSNYVFSHLNVDGIEVYDDQEQYISNNMSNIQTIEVIAYTTHEFINMTLIDADTYLNGALKEFEKLAEGFYNTPGPVEWSKFSGLLEGMQWVNLVISTIDSLNGKPENWIEFTTISGKLQIELRNLEEAIENSDFVLIADIIQYELLPLYEMLSQEIKETLESKGMRNNVN